MTSLKTRIKASKLCSSDEAIALPHLVSNSVSKGVFISRYVGDNLSFGTSLPALHLYKV